MKINYSAIVLPEEIYAIVHKFLTGFHKSKIAILRDGTFNEDPLLKPVFEKAKEEILSGNFSESVYDLMEKKLNEYFNHVQFIPHWTVKEDNKPADDGLIQGLVEHEKTFISPAHNFQNKQQEQETPKIVKPDLFGYPINPVEEPKPQEQEVDEDNEEYEVEIEEGRQRINLRMLLEFLLKNKGKEFTVVQLMKELNAGDLSTTCSRRYHQGIIGRKVVGGLYAYFATDATKKKLVALGKSKTGRNCHRDFVKTFKERELLVKYVPFGKVLQDTEIAKLIGVDVNTANCICRAIRRRFHCIDREGNRGEGYIYEFNPDNTFLHVQNICRQLVTFCQQYPKADPLSLARHIVKKANLSKEDSNALACLANSIKEYREKHGECNFDVLTAK